MSDQRPPRVAPRAIAARDLLGPFRRTVAAVTVVAVAATVMVLVVADPAAANPLSGGRWTLEKLDILSEQDHGSSSGEGQVSMSSDAASVGYVHQSGSSSGDRFLVLDSEQPDESLMVREPRAPGTPTGLDGMSRLSADGTTFVATYRVNSSMDELCSPATTTNYTTSQVLVWSRPSPTGQFGNPDLVTHEPSAGTDPCEGRATWSPEDPPLMGVGGDAASSWPSVSEDGASVSFVSQARNLGAAPTTPGRAGLFVRDYSGGAAGPVEMVTPAGLDADVTEAVMSSNGLHIAFVTEASTVVSGSPGDGEAQVYLASRSTVGGSWSFEAVSVSSSGTWASPMTAPCGRRA